MQNNGGIRNASKFKRTKFHNPKRFHTGRNQVYAGFVSRSEKKKKSGNQE
jgi:hypothetical protein